MVAKPAMSGVTETQLVIPAADGRPLSGLLIAPEAAKAIVLISPATGYPKEFYRRFAQAGAARGAACVIYDYRGAGGSAPASLKGFETDLVAWGRLDLEGVIQWASGRYRDLPILGVGHSLGGHLVAFAPSQTRFRRLLFLCVGAGYWRLHHWTSWARELVFWLVYGPVKLALHGYLPGGGLWSGAALPKGAFLQWRRWSLTADGQRTDVAAHGVSPNPETAAPIRSLVFSDDIICTQRAGAALLNIFPANPRELVLRAPSDYGLTRLGHDGAFRREAGAVWDEAWGWLLG